MRSSTPFDLAFAALTGYEPFPWQAALYEKFKHEIPPSCNLPTGVGKTSVIAVWLLALADGANVPRRLVYVVNRRTVVDQTTSEVERLRNGLGKKPELEKVRAALNAIGSNAMKDRVLHGESPLAISTLRGQFADNREWSTDPSRPAVICGTVDMIGSRLLFSGYGVGFKSKPLHAGFLGQDVLLVHDEAHLEPAFQELLVAIEKEQKRCNDHAKFTVMELSATSRGTGDAFPNDAERRKNEADPRVRKRIRASKTVRLHENQDAKKLPDEIGNLVIGHKDSGDAVLVFVRKVDDVEKIVKKLPAGSVEQLTGTMRGLERDALVKKSIFQRFLPSSSRAEGITAQDGTAYLVCTSAGEVGVNISADHLVCDLSTFDSMAQRFGRVNRFGERDDTVIDVVHPKESDLDASDPLESRRLKTLKLLKELKGDGCPAALGELDPQSRVDAFAPPPTILPATDILFDAWALTTIREKLPGRPPVEPYLHGIRDWEPPETQVSWREEVEIITGDLLERYPPTDLLDDYPLKPHELLRDRSDRIFKHLEVLAERHADEPAWIVDAREAVEVVTLAELADKRRKNRIDGCILLLPPSVGGLAGGLLDGTSIHANDVADTAVDEQGRLLRQRTWDDGEVPRYLRLIRTIDTRPAADDDEADEDSARRRYWHWYDLPREGGRTSIHPVTWNTHVVDVVNHAKRLIAGLSLPQEIADAVILAAELHDHGKRRERFQITLGNCHYPDVLLAKAGRGGARLPEPFRHEFASVLDAQVEARFQFLSDEMKDLVLHLIAAHHGRARPHFPPHEAFDPDRPLSDAEALAVETPRRFARLQRRYGRWGLAYLESLLRAADWAASAAPSAFADEPEAKQ
jgi:CRISPR-associated endonuclease/helicase Cas3